MRRVVAGVFTGHQSRVTIHRFIERSFQFAERVRVSGFFRRGDPLAENILRIRAAAQFQQELAVVVVARDIFGMRYGELVKITFRGRVIAGVHAFEGQAVSGERIRRIRGQEFFQHGAAGFLRVRHLSRIAQGMTGDW